LSKFAKSHQFMLFSAILWYNDVDQKMLLIFLAYVC